jgi:hypothetical protein
MKERITMQATKRTARKGKTMQAISIARLFMVLTFLLVAAPGRGAASARPDGVEPGTIDTTASVAAASMWSLMRPTSSEEPRILDRRQVRLNASPAVQLAQAAGRESEKTAAAPAEDQEKASLTEINKQLSNPVTSFWSLTFQFNNYSLENDHWNHNMQFQPVLPISLTKDWNLINRPVIPVYNSAPHPIGAGRFRQTTGFGDLADVEMVSPSDSGPWLLAMGPSFIFPTGSMFTGQGHYQAGPAAVLGYLTKDYIVGVFPQQWWSVDGGSRKAVSQMNLQPFFAYFISEGWSVGYSGNVLANWHASAGDVWTLPLGLALSKVQKLGILPVKFALAGQYMPVHPGEFGQEWNIQLVITPVIPKLFKGTIF